MDDFAREEKTFEENIEYNLFSSKWTLKIRQNTLDLKNFTVD